MLSKLANLPSNITFILHIVCGFQTGTQPKGQGRNYLQIDTKKIFSRSKGNSGRHIAFRHLTGFELAPFFVVLHQWDSENSTGFGIATIQLICNTSMFNPTHQIGGECISCH